MEDIGQYARAWLAVGIIFFFGVGIIYVVSDEDLHTVENKPVMIVQGKEGVPCTGTDTLRYREAGFCRYEARGPERPCVQTYGQWVCATGPNSPPGPHTLRDAKRVNPGNYTVTCLAGEPELATGPAGFATGPEYKVRIGDWPDQQTYDATLITDIAQVPFTNTCTGDVVMEQEMDKNIRDHMGWLMLVIVIITVAIVIVAVRMLADYGI